MENVNHTIRIIRNELAMLATSERKKSNMRFFKTSPGEYGEGDEFIGVSVPQLRMLSRKYQTLAEKALLELLKSKFHEDRLLALFIMVLQFRKGDVKRQKRLYDLYLGHTRYVNNWDLVDTSAGHIVGAYLSDKSRRILRSLARSDVLWERRIAMIACLYFIGKGESKDAIEIAQILLQDKHDLIHKAAGWMLREIGKRCSEKELTDFLDKHAAVMPRTMLRYAIERLSDRQKRHYLGLGSGQEHVKWKRAI